jgi:hypothetical protein
MYDVQRMQIVHTIGNVFGVAHSQLPWQQVVQIMYNVLERASTYILEYQIQVTVFGKHYAVEFDYIRMLKVAQDLRFFQKRIVRLHVFVFAFDLVWLIAELELFDDHRFARVPMGYLFDIGKKAFANLLVEYELVQMVDLVWLLHKMRGQIAK